MLEFLHEMLVDEILFASECDKSEYRVRLVAENARAEIAKIKSAVAEGKWICQCGHMNTKHAAECSSCGKWKSSCQLNTTALLKALEEVIAKTGAPVTSADPLETTELVLTADGKWICACGYKNRKNADECSACGNRKPSPQENKTAVQEVPAKSSDQPIAPVVRKWVCECGYANRHSAVECSACGKSKPSPQENTTAVQKVPEEITAQPIKSVENNLAAPADVSAKGIWFCGKCGSLNENAEFCKSCGNKKE